MERVELTQLGEGGREELGFAERVQQPDFGKGRILLPSEELQTPAPPSLTCPPPPPSPASNGCLWMATAMRTYLRRYVHFRGGMRSHYKQTTG